MTDDATPDDHETQYEDATPDAADPQAIAEAKRKSKFKLDQRSDFWRRTMADPIGRMVVWELLLAAGTFTERFAYTPAGFPSPEATWFHAGEQAYGQRIYRTLLKVDVNAVALMHREHDPDFFIPKPKRKRTET